MEEEKSLTEHEQMLWDLFIKEANPEMEFADTAHDNKKAIIKAMDAAYNLGCDSVQYW